MTILRCGTGGWNCSRPVESAADEFCKPCRVALSRGPFPDSPMMLMFNPTPRTAEAEARWRYTFADWMLAERRKGDG